MGNYIDMTNKRFGRLLVITRDFISCSSGIRWICKCDCGNVKSISGMKLRSGNTRSCRCLDTEMTIARTTKHGESHKTPEYYIWKSMRQRCNTLTYKSFNYYGGRGIKVCDRWNNYSNFIKDMGRRPTPKHQLDRINVNGNYEPNNCRWITQTENANNKRNNTMLTYCGITDTLPNWSRRLDIKQTTLRRRIFNYEWSLESAFETPVGRS
jgi:hypothetical protein